MRWFFSLCCFICFSSLLSAQNNDVTTASTIAPLLEWQVADAIDVTAFHPSQNQLATGGRDNAVRLWDSTTGNETAILSGHSNWITSLAYSPDGTVLASGGRDNMIWMWNVETQTSLRLIEDHQAEIKAMTFTPDGSFFISGDMNGIIRFEPTGNPASTQIFENFGGGIWSLAMSPDGKTLAVGSDDSTIWMIGLWDDDGTWVTPLEEHKTPVTSLTWSDDSTQLLSGEQNGHVILWDVSNVKSGEDSVDHQQYAGHLAPITSVDFTNHEELFISSALDGSIRLWDTTTATELTTAYQTSAPVTHMSTSSVNPLVASSSPAGNVKIWSLERDILVDVITDFRPVVIQNTPIPPTQQPVDIVENSTQQNTVDSNQNQSSPATINLPNTSSPTLMIPSVGMQVGIKTFPLDGVSWAIDPHEPLVGHLQGTSWVNGNGNVALAGHSLYPNGRAGVFNSLYNVNLGDEIIVQDGDIVKRYLVSDIRVVDYRDISVVYPTAHSRVTLITCDIPSFESQTGLYGERLVVIADAIN